MPFRDSFEREVNANMASSPTITGEGSSKHAEAFASRSQDTEARPSSVYTYDTKATDLEQEETTNQDCDHHHKSKAEAPPPRFSTLFTQPPPQPHQQQQSHPQPTPLPQPLYQNPYPPPRRGIHLPTPFFILLTAILFFESTLLFAYTLLGLYSNLPPPILALAGVSKTENTNVNEIGVGGCECSGRGGGVEISPNFYIGGGEGGVEGVGAAISTSISTTTTITAAAGEDASAAVENVLALLRPTSTPSSSTSSTNGTIRTVTAPVPVSTQFLSEVPAERETATRVTFVTSTVGGGVTEGSEEVRSTVTSVTVVDGAGVTGV